jgi:hypothetical protein
MKKHLLALLSVGSLVALLPGCGSCCEKKEVREEVATEANSEVAAVEATVSEAEITAQDAVAPEATPAVEDKH